MVWPWLCDIKQNSKGDSASVGPKSLRSGSKKETGWCKSTMKSVQRCEALTMGERCKERTGVKCDDITEADGGYLPWERRS